MSLKSNNDEKTAASVQSVVAEIDNAQAAEGALSEEKFASRSASDGVDVRSENSKQGFEESVLGDEPFATLPEMFLYANVLWQLLKRLLARAMRHGHRVLEMATKGRALLRELRDLYTDTQLQRFMRLMKVLRVTCRHLPFLPSKWRGTIEKMEQGLDLLWELQAMGAEYEAKVVAQIERGMANLQRLLNQRPIKARLPEVETLQRFTTATQETLLLIKTLSTLQNEATLRDYLRVFRMHGGVFSAPEATEMFVALEQLFVNLHHLNEDAADARALYKTFPDDAPLEQQLHWLFQLMESPAIQQMLEDELAKHN